VPTGPQSTGNLGSALLGRQIKKTGTLTTGNSARQPNSGVVSRARCSNDRARPRTQPLGNNATIEARQIAGGCQQFTGPCPHWKCTAQHFARRTHLALAHSQLSFSIATNSVQCTLNMLAISTQVWQCSQCSYQIWSRVQIKHGLDNVIAELRSSHNPKQP